MIQRMMPNDCKRYRLHINYLYAYIYGSRMYLLRVKHRQCMVWCHFETNCMRLIFSCDQAALWMVQSVRPSVRPSVCLSHLFDYVPIIMKFSGVITSDKSDVHAKGQGQRSEVKVTEVTTQFNRFRTVTPVWIHMWWSNDAYSLIMLRRGALLFFKVIRQISRSHGSKNRRIWPRLGVSGL